MSGSGRRTRPINGDLGDGDMLKMTVEVTAMMANMSLGRKTASPQTARTPSNPSTASTEPTPSTSQALRNELKNQSSVSEANDGEEMEVLQGDVPTGHLEEPDSEEGSLDSDDTDAMEGAVGGVKKKKKKGRYEVNPEGGEEQAGKEGQLELSLENVIFEVPMILRATQSAPPPVSSDEAGKPSSSLKEPVLDSASPTLDSARINLELASENLDSASTNLDSASTNLDSASTNLDSASTNLDSTSATLDSASTNLDSASTNLDSTSATLDSASTNLDSASTNLDAASTNLDANSPTLDELESAIAQAQAALANNPDAIALNDPNITPSTFWIPPEPGPNQRYGIFQPLCCDAHAHNHLLTMVDRVKRLIPLPEGSEEEKKREEDEKIRLHERLNVLIGTPGPHNPLRETRLKLMKFLFEPNIRLFLIHLFKRKFMKDEPAAIVSTAVESFVNFVLRNDAITVEMVRYLKLDQLPADSPNPRRAAPRSPLDGTSARTRVYDRKKKSGGNEGSERAL